MQSWFGHAVAASFGLAVILEVVAFSGWGFTEGLWYAGGAVAMLGVLVPGVLWFKSQDQFSFMKLGLVVSAFLATLFLMILPASPTAMVVLAWLSAIAFFFFFWTEQLSSYSASMGYTVGYGLYQLGVTLIPAGVRPAAFIGLGVVGAFIGIGSFYFEYFGLAGFATESRMTKSHSTSAPAATYGSTTV